MQSAGVAVNTKQENFGAAEFSTYWICMKNLPGDTLSAQLHTKCIISKTFQNQILTLCQLSELNGFYIEGPFWKSAICQIQLPVPVE